MSIQHKSQAKKVQFVKYETRSRKGTLLLLNQEPPHGPCEDVMNRPRRVLKIGRKSKHHQPSDLSEQRDRKGTSRSR
jgi:hypothetical protein